MIARESTQFLLSITQMFAQLSHIGTLSAQVIGLHLGSPDGLSHIVHGQLHVLWSCHSH